MGKLIEIKKLKHIQSLTFEIPDPGVYLLSGLNGSGKTSLLACLYRIGDSRAFSRHFRASVKSKLLDNFDKAEITYTLNGKSVTYAYGGERWVPTPRAESKLLASFGYGEVIYIGATADRISPRPEDFQPNKLSIAPQDIRDAANLIFSTTKFHNLKVINLKPGPGNQAFLLQATSPPNATYFSERNFSLGEICILKLLRQLVACKKGAMILIDELELALHPRAQIELLKYLRSFAPTRDLTVIFSTHSVSLLKSVPKENILFIDQAGGTAVTLQGCYPAYAIGSMASGEERAPDAVLYVEDEAAVYCTEALVQMYLDKKSAVSPALRPTTQIMPIGPFISVVRHLVGSDAVLPSSTKSAAILDLDVKNESVAAWTANGNHNLLAEFSAQHTRLRYLPWTPEVGLVSFLQQPGAIAQQAFRAHFGNNLLTVLPADIGVIPTTAGGPQRDACKKAVTNVTRTLKTHLAALSEREVKRQVYAVFVKWYFDNNVRQVMSLMASVLP